MKSRRRRRDYGAFWVRVHQDRVREDRRDALDQLREIEDEIGEIVFDDPPGQLSLGQLRRWAELIAAAIALIEEAAA
jgi:hypothetical protein